MARDLRGLPTASDGPISKGGLTVLAELFCPFHSHLNLNFMSTQCVGIPAVHDYLDPSTQRQRDTGSLGAGGEQKKVTFSSGSVKQFKNVDGVERRPPLA